MRILHDLLNEVSRCGIPFTHRRIYMDLKSRLKRGRGVGTITSRRKERLETALRQRQFDMTLVVENVWDPHNVAAILRSADAAGVAEMHLLYYVETLPNVKRIGKQSSSSANKWIDFHVHESVSDCVTRLRDEGYMIYASHLSQSSTSLYDIDATKKCAFVVGNESRGVSDELAAAADAVFSIPMMGMVQSLNVSVATAITLYEALRQRLAAGMYEKSRLAGEELATLLGDWSRR